MTRPLAVPAVVDLLGLGLDALLADRELNAKEKRPLFESADDASAHQRPGDAIQDRSRTRLPTAAHVYTHARTLPL